jgi:hypothetical protein
MIGGSPIGSDNVGSFSIDNFVFGLRSGGVGLSGGSGSPGYSFGISAPGLSGSGSEVQWAVVGLTVPASLGLGSNQIQSEVIGSLEVEFGSAGMGLGLPAIGSDIILTGVPDFFVTRAGTSATITVRNRGTREVRLFRADDYNLNFTQIGIFTSDTFTDTGLDATKNYKYKLAFTISLTPPIDGQKSISKFTIV